MNDSKKPLVLAVDDEPELTRSELALGSPDGVHTRVEHPRDVSEVDLDEADLILVDYQVRDWPEREEASSLSLRPPNGLALAVVLREQADEAVRERTGDVEERRACAFALHSGHLDEILGRLREKPRPHLIAKLNNLEWAFSKTDPTRFHSMASLAQAVRALPQRWPSDQASVQSVLRSLLKVDEQESSDHCWRDVGLSRAPVDELRGAKHSLVPLRWLLHEILPYPTFLWPPHWVAARLGITSECLTEVLREDTRLTNCLASARYTGLLSDFFSRGRWWKASLEKLVWTLSGDARDISSRRKSLDELAGRDLEHVDAAPVVVCLGSDLVPEELSSASDAVRIRPDHWPSFADDPWVTLELLKEDQDLRALVDPLDLEEIDGEQEDE